MTTDRDRLHALADEAGRGHVHLSGGMLAGLLDALTRAEAQAAIRGRAVAIYQRRAREAETERDWNWRSSRQSKIERIKANARADRAEAEARTQRHRADDMEDNALRAQTNRQAAEERIEAVRELHTRTWHGELDYCPRCVDFEGAIWPCKTIRTLEGDTDG